VNPEYGDLADLEQLLAAAHQRGMFVILDLPLNHTSVEHPWFQAALDSDSPYRDWYVWSQDDDTTPGPWGQQVWHAAPTGGFYYGVFWEGMPDLNYNNPDVTTEMQSVVRFWLEEVGVDGFRLDGTRYYVEEADTLADSAANHAWLRDFREFYKTINPETLTVAEVWTSGFVVRSYLKGDQVDLAFDFDLASAFISSAASQRASSALNQLKFSMQGVPPGQFAPFLTNHDIDRVMTELGGDEQAARHAATMLLTAPGVPFLYYGEEIGMVGQKPDEKIRTPLQWSAEENAGFSSSSPWQRLNPDFTAVNIAAQIDDPGSLLAHYRRLIHLRNTLPALRVGNAVLLESDHPAVYAILRMSMDQTLLVLINLADEPVSDYGLAIRNSDLRGVYRLIDVMGETAAAELAVDESGGFTGYLPLAELPAHTSLILELESLP
ncbi:MAG TPA: alpha-amylase family glycosyl hydrolase, partial [Anaerolineales bacterium]|nr:alpha-amylase family glycosyl hydrolase [Anaerolineales bacterium]